MDLSYLHSDNLTYRRLLPKKEARNTALPRHGPGHWTNAYPHKAFIIRLHLQGMTVLEIARQTYHNPRSIDAYIKTFDAVLILYLYGLNPTLMASVLGRGESLITKL